MTRGMKAPLSGSEITVLVGLVGHSPPGPETAPAIRKRLLTLDLIAEAHDGIRLTATGQRRAESELKSARGARNNPTAEARRGP